MKKSYTHLLGGDFSDSFLVRVEVISWPNDYLFFVWSPRDNVCYRISMQTILEYHHLRIGTGPLLLERDGLPLDNIYVTFEEEHEYWVQRIGEFSEQGFDSGLTPICIEFCSPLFANRKRQFLKRDRNTGILVVCRDVIVQPDQSYEGPRPVPYTIPSDGGKRINPKKR